MKLEPTCLPSRSIAVVSSPFNSLHYSSSIVTAGMGENGDGELCENSWTSEVARGMKEAEITAAMDSGDVSMSNQMLVGAPINGNLMVGNTTSSNGANNSVVAAAAAFNGGGGDNMGSGSSEMNGSHRRNSTYGLNGMQPRQRRKVPEGELCAVCSDRATGYHYGVASCNGCKTFFRRTIVSEHTFVCQYDGHCDVNKNVRCACRHCRFKKCLSVGMDSKAIQNDRDRIGPTKKFRLSMGSDDVKRNRSVDGDDAMMSFSREGSPVSPNLQLDDKVVEHLIGTENLCNRLRNCVLEECKSVKETLMHSSLLYQAPQMAVEPNTEFKELYPASMNDIQMWNIRELRLCIEWAKTFDQFAALSIQDRFHLLRNFAFTFNILNRVYYSLNYGNDKIVYPNGAFILRQVQKEVQIPGCRSIYHRQMDEIMLPFRKLEVSIAEFAAFKACLLFNPDACDLSPGVRADIAHERSKYMATLFNLIAREMGLAATVEKYSNILMMAPSIQNIIDQNEDNMQVMEVFGNFWRISQFVKELCMKRELST